jgi:hypothetical protein
MEAVSKAGAITLLDLQRWCARENAQIIFNSDGTVYSAMGEQVTHHPYRFAVLAAMIHAGMIQDDVH